MRSAMFPVQPDSTVTVDCKENPLECQPCSGAGACYELAEPPPPHLPVIPRASPDADHHAHVRLGLLLAVSLLSAFLFLSLALATLLLYRRRRRILRRRRHAAVGALPDEDWLGDGDEEGGGGGGAGVVHHVWYIRTVGLDDATIASISTVEYRGGVVARGGDCAVCLGEFSDWELVRLLPSCAHPFHASCIDTWLRAHVNCPLCRSPVVVVPSDLSAAASQPEADVAQNEERELLDELSPPEVELQAEGSEVSEISSDTQSEGTAAAGDDSGRVTPSPIRRSASMDSPTFLVSVPETRGYDTQCTRKSPSAQDMRVFRVKGKQASGISSSSCQAGRFKIGRSISSSGLGFFFSRNGCSSGTVLPL